jgi:pentose-5-phosphate-3-epimerase
MLLMEATLLPKEERHAHYLYPPICMMQQGSHTDLQVSIHLMVKDLEVMVEEFLLPKVELV